MIREIHDFSEKYITEAKDKKLVDFSAPFLVADEVNANKRRYPFEVLKKAVNQFNLKIKEGKAWGGDQHPSSGQLETKNVSHRITKIELKDKTAWITGRILSDTSEGSKILSMIKSGGTVGISARGYGNVKSKGGVNEIQKDYQLAGVDFVINPSVGIAQVNQSNIFESAPIEKEEKFDVSLVQFNLMVEKYMSDIYEQNPNISNSLEERAKFYDENWNKYSAIIEEQLKEKNLKIEEPKIKKEVGRPVEYTEEYALFEEAIHSGYKKSFEEFCKEILPDISGFNDSETELELGYYEAQKSGFKGSLKEYNKIMEESQNG